MKLNTPLKLTCVGAFVAALGVGCASSGYARYDADSTDRDVGVAASADVGTDRDVRIASSTDTDIPADADRHESRGASAQLDTGSDSSDMAEGEDRVTVSALSFNPETRAKWVNKFPFYDQNWNIKVIETYTFAPQDDFDAPDFRLTMRPGEGYSEAAGGVGTETGGRRVIQHSPNPR